MPLQSYDETIRRGMSFLLDDHMAWFKGSAESITDESGKVQMPWVYYSNVQHSVPRCGVVSAWVRASA